MKSVRGYLLSRLLGGSALVLAVAGFTVYFLVARSIERHFDRNLADRVRGFASILFQVEDEVEFEFSGQLMPEYEREEFPSYFQLWFADGRLLERSESLGERDLVVPIRPGKDPRHWSAALPDGRKGRYVARLMDVHHVYPEMGPDRPDAAKMLVVVAQGRESIVAAERELGLQCLVVCLVLIALIGVISWIAVRKGLEPTNRLAAALDAIRVERPPEGLDVGALPRELVPMAQTTDDLIRRVDSALSRERRTTADIAHELRTPISEVLTASEVALRNRDDVEGAHAALGTVRDVAWRMGRSVSTLLKLARLEMGAEAFEREVLDLGQTLADLLPGLVTLARARGVRLEGRLEAGELVCGDREVLRIVLSNLLSNALYHSPRGGEVTWWVEREPDLWRIVVENDGGQLRPEDLPTLSAPFWRKESSRADRDRSGLGLALSCALAEKSEMSLSFELVEGAFRAILSGAMLGGEEGTGPRGAAPSSGNSLPRTNGRAKFEG